MWIESHQSLARHPKLIRLAGFLRAGKPAVIGHLHLLWWWAMDFAPGGDLSSFSPLEIAAAAEWPHSAEKFHRALHDSLLLDPDGRIHDWHDYAGKLIEKRESDRERKSRQKTFHRNSTGIPPEFHRNSQVPDRTVPNQPIPKASPQAAVDFGNGVSKVSKIDAAPIPSNLDTPEFADAWKQWIQHRREIRKPMKLTGETAMLAKLSGMGHDAAMAAMLHSIANGWQGIFEHRTAPPGASHRETPEEFAKRNSAKIAKMP